MVPALTVENVSDTHSALFTVFFFQNVIDKGAFVLFLYLKVFFLLKVKMGNMELLTAFIGAGNCNYRNVFS